MSGAASGKQWCKTLWQRSHAALKAVLQPVAACANGFGVRGRDGSTREAPAVFWGFAGVPVSVG